jgi:hypothetical protein
MPTYRVTTRIYNEWTHDFEAPDEETAKEMAYDESQPDIGPNDYVQITAVEVSDAD